MIFELAQDLHDALAAMPREHTKHRILRLLEEAIRRDIHFIARHPGTVPVALLLLEAWVLLSPGTRRSVVRQSRTDGGG